MTITIDNTEISGLTIDGENVQEVTMDGDVVWAARPSSAIHHWLYDEGSGSTVVDDIGNADGTINGPTWVSGDYRGGSALDGDGVDDYVETSTLGNFGSDRDTDFAILLTVDGLTSTDLMRPIGAENSDGVDRMWVSLNRGPDGAFGLELADSNGNEYRVYSDGGQVGDGAKHRLVINKVANSGTDGVKLYNNATETPITVDADQGFGSAAVSDFDNPLCHFLGKISGKSFVDAILDDIIICDDSLTASEIQDDYDAQPWS